MKNTFSIKRMIFDKRLDKIEEKARVSTDEAIGFMDLKCVIWLCKEPGLALPLLALKRSRMAWFVKPLYLEKRARKERDDAVAGESSQCHRFRALVLLGRFLDMGPWVVDMALSVGILLSKAAMICMFHSKL
ncbi:Regulatory-associated of TOR 1-like protein [Gossypium australe]|uniref:Regulatory-associated of TOR 1-like protein n=1 Tax=Gossypium australe TaxID=47621 RepID=A0A5B6WKF6_9ROSI|nr:Regulatory-associated of TOR 1-like protein [Gossypium australe]